MRAEQRREIVSTFEEAKLSRSLSQSTHSVSDCDNSGPSSTVISQSVLKIQEFLLFH